MPSNETPIQKVKAHSILDRLWQQLQTYLSSTPYNFLGLLILDRGEMLFLKETPLDTILSMEEIIEAVEESLKEMALGRGFDLPRRRIHHPNRMIFGLLPGSFQGAMGAYLQTDLDRRIHHETVILYSVETGAPLILFQDCRINELRTGAAGAIGAKYLARKKASRVAVLGSAVHAETQLQAVCAVRPITSAKVFSPTPEHRQAFAEKMSGELKIDIRPAESSEEALEDSDVVIAVTNSRTPVFDGKGLGVRSCLLYQCLFANRLTVA